MKVDPEQLEREAEELLKQMMERNANPQSDNQTEEDTSHVPEHDDNPPAESADTGEDGVNETPHSEDRGDQQSDEGDGDLRKQLRIAEERVKNAQARMTKATQETADLRRQMMELQSNMAGLQSRMAETASHKDEMDDELRTLAEEYPDIASPLLKKLSRLEETVSEYRTQMAAKESQGTLQAHFDSIRKSHPDMDDIVTSDDFNGWLDRQSPVWKRVAQDGSAQEVVDLLDRYRDVLGTPPQQPESKVERARRVAEPSMPKARKPDPNSGKRVWTREEITRMPLNEFEKRQGEIDQAYLDGRVR
jgi:hypothetical protein